MLHSNGTSAQLGRPPPLLGLGYGLRLRWGCSGSVLVGIWEAQILERVGGHEVPSVTKEVSTVIESQRGGYLGQVMGWFGSGRGSVTEESGYGNPIRQICGSIVSDLDRRQGMHIPLHFPSLRSVPSTWFKAV